MNKRRNGWWRCFAFLLLAGGAAGPLAAQEHQTSPKNCGLYSMYSIFQWFGKEVDIAEIIKPEYLSVPEGSTMTDLVKVASVGGLEATAVKNLTASTLRESPHPIICSVRKDPAVEAFNHYVVVFPSESGDPVAYDALDDTTVPLSNILNGRWNGFGVVVSEVPVQLAWLFWPKYLALFLAVLAIVALRWAAARWREGHNAGSPTPAPAVRGAVEALVLILVATGVAAANQVMRTESSFLHDPSGNLQAIQERHFGMFLTKVSAQEVEGAMEKGALVIDARQPRDYGLGHIEGAINITQWDDAASFDKLLDGMAPDREIVVYCQSAGCPYAVEVSKELFRRGYENLKYYKPGWIDWEERNPGKEGDH